MGYRSEVAIAMQEKDFVNLIKLAKENFSTEKDEETVADLIRYSDKILKKDDVVIIHWDWIKWYDDFPDVSYVMSFIREKADGYAFVEIGEDGNTNKEYGDRNNGQDFYDYIDDVHEVYILGSAEETSLSNYADI